MPYGIIAITNSKSEQNVAGISSSQFFTWLRGAPDSRMTRGTGSACNLQQNKNRSRNGHRDRGHHVHEAWLIRDLNAEVAQILGKVRTTRCERDLGRTLYETLYCARGEMENRIKSASSTYVLCRA
jgi:hypothetical protein